MLWEERHRIGGRRALAAQKRLPIVIEVGEVGGHVDRLHFHAVEPGAPAQRSQRVRPTDLEPSTLVERRCGRVEAGGRAPEDPYQLHLTGVVPDVRTDHAARPDDPTSFGHGAGRIGNEVEDEA